MLDAIIMSDIPRTVADSFDQVVRHQQPRVLRVAYRITGNWADAEDVAQEAFVRLHHRGVRFPSDAALAAWLYRVTLNLCFDRARRARPAGELPDLPFAGISAEGALIRDEERRMLAAALARLPVKERAAIVLREIEGLSTAEVAEVLGSSEGTVRSQVAKAMARLREMLS
jgi:RNA polymerase sigma-70 factor (ECF subfamily)